jgi:hypothetical protein
MSLPKQFVGLDSGPFIVRENTGTNQPQGVEARMGYVGRQNVILATHGPTFRKRVHPRRKLPSAGAGIEPLHLRRPLRRRCLGQRRMPLAGDLPLAHPAMYAPRCFPGRRPPGQGRLLSQRKRLGSSGTKLLLDRINCVRRILAVAPSCHRRVDGLS